MLQKSRSPTSGTRVPPAGKRSRAAGMRGASVEKVMPKASGSNSEKSSETGTESSRRMERVRTETSRVVPRRSTESSARSSAQG